MRASTRGRPKYGGLDVSEIKRLRGLGAEDAKLKRLLAEAMLDNVALKETVTLNEKAATMRVSTEPKPAGDHEISAMFAEWMVDAAYRPSFPQTAWKSDREAARKAFPCRQA